jgi:hypothetical protein
MTAWRERHDVGGECACKRINMCKTDAHAGEEGMRGTHARRPSQDRVRVLVRECNGW